MATEILMSMKRVRPQVEIDSVKESHQFGNRRAFDVLMEAQQYWDNMYRFRLDRERNKRYCYGDQWGDMITYYDDKKMRDVQTTEEEYIKEQGSVPLKNNLIRRLVKNVLGIYRGQAKEPVCTARDRDEQQLGETMSTVLQYNMQLNRLNGLYARMMEEFMISGFVASRKYYGWKNNKMDVWTEYIQPNNFFIDNNMRDPRGWDCSFLGEVHRIPFTKLAEKYAHSPEEYEWLSHIYSAARNRRSLSLQCERFGYSRIRNYDFLLDDDPTMCRVIEVWRKETKPRYRCHDWNTGDFYKIDEEDYKVMVEAVNQSRLERGLAAGMEADDIPLIEAEWFVDEFWYYYHLTPFGDILEEGESPYDHKEHPYVFKAYPFIDGEIHSFVADVIDQQRYTNRLITLYDWIMRSSAKGVLMIPEQALEGNSMTLEEIADEWTRFNGVIVFKAKAGIEMPKQIASNSTNIGINELLQLQLKFFEDISGVNGALQGQPGYAGESGQHAQVMAQNAATSLIDLLETFSEFVVDGANKDVKLIQQYYDEKRIMNIAGRKAMLKKVDPQKVLNTEFDLSITESQATPAYRQLANEMLLELWRAQAINTEQLLEQGNFPFGDALLQSIRSNQEQIQNGQMPQAISPEIMQQAAARANQPAVNTLYGAMRDAA